MVGTNKMLIAEKFRIPGMVDNYLRKHPNLKGRIVINPYSRMGVREEVRKHPVPIILKVEPNLSSAFVMFHLSQFPSLMAVFNECSDTFGIDTAKYIFNEAPIIESHYWYDVEGKTSFELSRGLYRKYTNFMSIIPGYQVRTQNFCKRKNGNFTTGYEKSALKILHRSNEAENLPCARVEAKFKGNKLPIKHLKDIFTTRFNPFKNHVYFNDLDKKSY